MKILEFHYRIMEFMRILIFIARITKNVNIENQNQNKISCENQQIHETKIYNSLPELQNELES